MATFDERFPYMAPSFGAMDKWRADTPVPDFSGGSIGPKIVTDAGPQDGAPTGGFTVTDFNFNGLPSTFAPSQTSQGNVQTSQGGTGAGFSLSSPAPSYGTSPSNAQSGAQPSAASGVVSGSIADYFYRVVIVILGFIFVAIGLNMFKPGIVPNPVNLVKRK